MYTLPYPDISKKYGIPQSQMNGFDYGMLGRSIGNELARSPRINISLDESGFTTHIENGLESKKYLSSRHKIA